nr:retrotransposon protein, putative, Ty3-gypsy subclass [Tanacetum cinerariifolium]
MTSNCYFGEIHPEEVRFMFKPKRQISCTITLYNGSKTGYLAFKVNDEANAKLYHVEPKVGVIKPLSTCRVQFTRRAQDVMPPPSQIAKEMFLLQRAWYTEDISIKKPKVGVIKPLSTCRVQFTRRAQDVMPPPSQIAKEMFLLQRAWYTEDISIKSVSNMFHRGHVNVNARKLTVVLDEELKVEEEIIRDLERLDIELYVRGQHGYWASLRIKPDLISLIKEAQKEDHEIWTIVENLDKPVEFRIDEDNVLWQDTRLVVPNDASLREALLTEAHSSPFFVHPGSTKMYHDLKQHFWWSGMKRDVATLVSRCLICQQVKIEHQRASGLLQPLNIPVWKWDEISMDFVTGLPQTQRRHDAI